MPVQELNERTKWLYRPVNDLGGQPREPLNLAEHAMQAWEKRCHALLESLNAHGVLTMEEKRRWIEDMSRTLYAALTYYEKWAMCAANVLMTKGHFTPTSSPSGSASSFSGNARLRDHAQESPATRQKGSPS